MAAHGLGIDGEDAGGHDPTQVADDSVSFVFEVVGIGIAGGEDGSAGLDEDAAAGADGSVIGQCVKAAWAVAFAGGRGAVGGFVFGWRVRDNFGGGAGNFDI